jgi:2-phospho-L-lactate guanylyltransferase
MKTNIVIPMKAPNISKTRLGPFFSSVQRQRLAVKMFESTLIFFSQHFPNYHVLVVTSSVIISRIAEKHGATVLIERTPGLNQAATSGAVWSTNHGFDSQLLIPADIARLDVEEMKTLLSAKRALPSVLLVPAEDHGTNALLTTPPDAIEFSYGINSSMTHEQATVMQSIDFQSIALPHLALDVDTPSDVAQLVAMANPLIQELVPQWN